MCVRGRAGGWGARTEAPLTRSSSRTHTQSRHPARTPARTHRHTHTHTHACAACLHPCGRALHAQLLLADLRQRDAAVGAPPSHAAQQLGGRSGATGVIPVMRGRGGGAVRWCSCGVARGGQPPTRTHTHTPACLPACLPHPHHPHPHSPLAQAHCLWHVQGVHLEGRRFRWRQGGGG